MPVMERRQGTSQMPDPVHERLCPYLQVRERGMLEVQNQQQLWPICLRQQYRHHMERKGELSR